MGTVHFNSLFTAAVSATFLPCSPDGLELVSETLVADRPPAASIPMGKRKEMIEFWRNNKGCTMADVARVGQCSVGQAAQWVGREKRGEGLMDKPKGRKAKWSVPRAVVEIAKVLPEIHVTDEELNWAAEATRIPGGSFRHIRSEVQTRLQTAVVDHWFGGDLRGEREVLRYIQEAVKSIKIGVDVLTNKELLRALAVAVGRRVSFTLVIDLKISYSNGLEGVKMLLEAGVQVCHCTEELQWNAAIFDGQILVQGSQSWTDSNSQGFNLSYTMVLAGPIVSAFERQFDTMVEAMTKGGNTGDSTENEEIDLSDDLSMKGQAKIPGRRVSMKERGLSS